MASKHNSRQPLLIPSIILEILNYLPTAELKCSCRVVCKVWYNESSRILRNRRALKVYLTNYDTLNEYFQASQSQKEIFNEFHLGVRLQLKDPRIQRFFAQFGPFITSLDLGKSQWPNASLRRILSESLPNLEELSMQLRIPKSFCSNENLSPSLPLEPTPNCPNSQPQEPSPPLVALEAYTNSWTYPTPPPVPGDYGYGMGSSSDFQSPEWNSGSSNFPPALPPPLDWQGNGNDTAYANPGQYSNQTYGYTSSGGEWHYSSVSKEWQWTTWPHYIHEERSTSLSYQYPPNQYIPEGQDYSSQSHHYVCQGRVEPYPAPPGEHTSGNHSLPPYGPSNQSNHYQTQGQQNVPQGYQNPPQGYQYHSQGYPQGQHQPSNQQSSQEYQSQGQYPPNPSQGHHYPPNPTQGYQYPLNPTQGYQYPPNPSQGYQYPPNPPQGHHYPPNPSQGHHYPPNPSQGHHYPPNPSQGQGQHNQANPSQGWGHHYPGYPPQSYQYPPPEYNHPHPAHTKAPRLDPGLDRHSNIIHQNGVDQQSKRRTISSTTCAPLRTVRNEFESAAQHKKTTPPLPSPASLPDGQPTLSRMKRLNFSIDYALSWNQEQQDGMKTFFRDLMLGMPNLEKISCSKFPSDTLGEPSRKDHETVQGQESNVQPLLDVISEPDGPPLVHLKCLDVPVKNWAKIHKIGERFPLELFEWNIQHKLNFNSFQRCLFRLSQTLIKLTINFSGANENLVKHLEKDFLCFKALNRLKYLNLIDYNGSLGFVRVIPGLETLILDNSKPDFEVLFNRKHFSSRGQSSNDSLQSLTIGNCKHYGETTLTSKIVGKIAQAFPALRNLELEFVGDEVLKSVFENFLKLETLKILDGLFSDECFIGITSKSLASFLRRKIDTTRLKHPIRQYPFIGSLKQLKKLDICSKYMTDLSVFYGILDCKNLTSLTLQAYGLTNASLMRIGDEMNLVFFKTIRCHQLTTLGAKFIKEKMPQAHLSLNEYESLSEYEANRLFLHGLGYNILLERTEAVVQK